MISIIHPRMSRYLPFPDRNTLPLIFSMRPEPFIDSLIFNPGKPAVLKPAFKVADFTQPVQDGQRNN